MYDDPLDDLLAPPSAEPPPLPASTLAVLRGRRWRRALGRVWVPAAAFALGVLTRFSWDAPPAPVAAPPPPAVKPKSAQDYEWIALEIPDEAAENYRRAGDAYMNDGDFASAARTYGHSLERTDPKTLEADEGDSWLMMAIKRARREEAGR